MRRVILATTTLLSVALIVMAAQKPDFSGEWTLDRARSFGMPGDMQQTMIVRQTAEQIELETKLIQPNNERTVKDSYTLDGKEHEFTPQAPPNAPPPAKGKRTANWLPGNRGIVVNESSTVQTPNGPAPNQLTRKWTLSSDGELTIDMYIDGPNGSFETKRIFKKK